MFIFTLKNLARKELIGYNFDIHFCGGYIPCCVLYNGTITWKRFPHYMSFVMVTLGHRWVPHKGTGVSSFDVFFVVNPSKWLNKQSSYPWFEMPWRLCYVTLIMLWDTKDILYACTYLKLATNVPLNSFQAILIESFVNCVNMKRFKMFSPRPFFMVHLYVYVTSTLIKCVSDMMTSSNGNIFRVTAPLWGELSGHWRIALTKATDAELWCFLWSATE